MIPDKVIAIAGVVIGDKFVFPESQRICYLEWWFANMQDYADPKNPWCL